MRKLFAMGSSLVPLSAFSFSQMGWVIESYVLQAVSLVRSFSVAALVTSFAGTARSNLRFNWGA